MVEVKICCKIWGIFWVSIATKDRPAGRVLWSLPEGRGGNHHCRSRLPFQHQNGGLTTARFHFLLPCLLLNWLSQGSEQPGKAVSSREALFWEKWVVWKCYQFLLCCSPWIERCPRGPSGISSPASDQVMWPHAVFPKVSPFLENRPPTHCTVKSPSASPFLPHHRTWNASYTIWLLLWWFPGWAGSW